MIRKFFKVSAVTLLLALSLVSLTAKSVLAQRAGSGANIPGIDALSSGFGGSGSAPGISGSSPLQNDDVFERAKVPGDLGFMKDMWGLTRKLTNVMVVIFLFIAAAATTLNFQVSTYGIKKTLPSVLLATLYANFSYAIAQLFNSVNMAFMKAFTGSATSAMSLMSNFIKGPLDTQYGKINIDNGWGGNMMALLVLAIMAVLAIGLLVLVILFVVRNYFLAMLIAIAPIAFMCLAMPFTQGAFKKWWDQFIRWMFFPAIAGFWLYMGGVALTAAGISGGLIGIVMAALILWVAIRTPFTIGAGVGAVAGFITGNAVTRGIVGAGRSTAGALGKSTKNQAIIAMHKTPFLGATVRGVGYWGKWQEARVKEAQSGGIMKQKNRPEYEEKAGWKGLSLGQKTRFLIDRGRYYASGSGIHNVIASGVNRIAYRQIGKAEQGAAIAEGEVQNEVDRGKNALLEDPGFRARLGELNSAKTAISETMAALTAEGENLALNRKSIIEPTRKLMQEERELARQRKLTAENMKNTLLATMANEGVTQGSLLNQQVERRAGAIMHRAGANSLVEAVASTSMEAKSATEMLQTTMDQEMLKQADRNVSNDKIITALTEERVLLRDLSDAQQTELQRHMDKHFDSSGIEGSGDIVRDAHRYVGTNLTVAGVGANTEQARRIEQGRIQRTALQKKYMGFQGEMGAKAQEVQTKYFRPEDWQRTIAGTDIDTMSAFLENRTTLGQLNDAGGNVIQGTNAEQISAHDKLIRDLHATINGAYNTVQHGHSDNSNFEGAVRTLQNTITQAGFTIEPVSLGRINAVLARWSLAPGAGGLSFDARREAITDIARIFSSQSGLVINRAGAPFAGTFKDLIAATGVSSKYGPPTP